MHQLDERGSHWPDGVKARYEYDAQGKCIAKRIARNGKTITYVQYSDHAGPLAKLEDGKVYYYAMDHLGTPQELHDEHGKMVWAVEYNAYGQVRRYMTYEISHPVRFAGQHLDDETGRHYSLRPAGGAVCQFRPCSAGTGMEPVCLC